MKYLFSLLLIAIIINCVGPRVAYDYNTQKDFSTYKTYNYYPELKTGLSDLDNKRLFTTTDSLMKSKGFNRINNPELYINFKSKQYQTPTNNRIGIGVGNRPINIGGSIPFGGPDQHIQLTMDFVDVSKDELIWQAEVDDVQNSSYTPENRSAFFYVMMEKVLNKYPPKKKK